MPSCARLAIGLSMALSAAVLTGGCNTLRAPAEAAASPAPAAATPEKSQAQTPVQTPAKTPPPVQVSTWTADTLSDLLVAELAGQRGQLGLAVESYLRQAEKLRDPAIAARAARIAWLARLSDEALRASTLWAELAPNDPEASAHAVMSLIQAGRIEEADPLLERLLSNPAQPLRFNFIVQYARDASPELRQRVSGLLAGLSQRHPENPRLWLARAALEEIDNRLEKSLVFVQTARGLQPDDPATLDLEGRLLLATGQPSAARRHFARAVKKYPAERDLRLNYVRALLEDDRGDLARKELLAMLAKWPDNPDLSYSLARLDWEAGNTEAALERMVALAESGYREDEAWMYAGQIAAGARRYEEAVGYFQNVRGGNFVPAQVQVAHVWQLTGRLPDARQLLTNLRRQSPESAASLYVAESDLLWRAGDGTGSVELLERALALMPLDKELHYAYALAAERVGRIDVTERELRALIEAAPDSAMLLNALGYTLTDRTDRHDEARQLIERAIVLAPDDTAVIDSMGWVNYRQGNLVEAERWLRRAASLNADGEIAAHLGEVLWMAGKKREAKRVWSRAQARDPENLILKRTVERFLK